MFGYCHKDECMFDFWSPSDCSDVENRAFSGYVVLEQEKEDVINMIVAAARNGETELDIELDNDFSEEDLKYVDREVQKRLANNR